MAAVALVPNWRQHKGDVRNHNRRGFLLLLLPMTAPSGPRRGDTGLRQTTPKAIQAAAAVAVVPTGITALHSEPCGALRPLTNTGPDTRRRSSSRNRKRRTPRATMSSRIRRPFRVTAATTTKTTSGTSVWFASGGCISKNTAASRAARGRAGRPSERPNARVRATLYVAEAFLSPFNLFPLSIHSYRSILGAFLPSLLSYSPVAGLPVSSTSCLGSRPSTRQTSSAPASVVLLRLFTSLLSSLPSMPPPPLSVPRLAFQFELVARPFPILFRYNTRLALCHR